jgi:Uncharacterized protein conserved in bacteria (DUF2155)
LKRVAAAVAMSAVAIAACRERGRPNPDIRMAISHESAEPAGQPSQTPGDQNAAPTRLEIPPEVAQVWSGIRIGWKDKSNGSEGVIDVPLGGATPLPDPSLVVRADAFLPAFTMGAGAITSEGVEPQNPAARIAVLEKGKEVFAGWIFTRFPDVHPFAHPRFQLRLQGGVPRARR